MTLEFRTSAALQFLLNDTLMDMDVRTYSPPMRADRFAALSLDFITRLGQELYAEEPLLHRVAPERARRLIALILSKAPEVNAALFVAPARGCRPETVAVRYAELDVRSQADLYARNVAGKLDAESADRQVWRRLAA